MGMADNLPGPSLIAHGTPATRSSTRNQRCIGTTRCLSGCISTAQRKSARLRAMSCPCAWAEQQAASSVGTFRSYRHWPRWSTLPFCSSDRGSSALSITNPSLLDREEMARERNGCDFHSVYGDCSERKPDWLQVGFE